MITREDAEKLRIQFSMAGWTEVMRPRIENRIRQLIKLLILYPSERPEEDRDDSKLRGRIQELEWMLVSWQNELLVSDNNRRIDELDRAAEQNGTEVIGSGSPANP